MIVGIHALQALGPSALNRDEHGFPKTLSMGGTRRGRISSQAQKRSIRKWVEEELPTAAGIRTVHVRDRLLLPILRQMPDASHYNQQELRAIADQVLAAFVGKFHKDGTSVSAIFTWPGEIELLAKMSAEQAEDLLDSNKGNRTAKRIAGMVTQAGLFKPFSIAAFGRMIAVLPTGRIDGATAFSHAFTTHAVVLDLDNFTAIDDLAETEEASTFHLNDQPFLAPSVFYRHFSIDTRVLQQHMGSLSAARDSVRLILEAFWHAKPSCGKIRSYKADDKPQMVVAHVNGDGSSRGAAFTDPVSAERDMLVASIRTFDDWYRRLELMRRRPDNEHLYTVTAYPEVLDTLRQTVLLDGYDALIERVLQHIGEEESDAQPLA